MVEIAKYVRIFDAQPSDDLVTKRTTAIKELSAKFNEARPVASILKDANNLATALERNGHVSAELSASIEQAVKKSADAFIAEGQELQTVVCGAMAALQALENSQPSKGSLSTTDVFGIGLWAALSYQSPRSEPKLEDLRRELLNRSRQFTMATAESARQRTPVPDVSYKAPETFDASTVGQAFKKGAQPALEALKANAALDREEIDFLWWVLSDWSTLMGERFSSAGNSVAAAIASGIEAGGMLRRMPADAHHHMALRNVKAGEPLTLSELLKAIADVREALSSSFSGNQIVHSCPAVFPLITALLSGKAGGHGARAKRPLDEWTGRGLLESSIVHVCSQLPAISL